MPGWSASYTPEIRICTVTVTDTATTLKDLVDTRLTGLSKTMPAGNVVQIALTPAANITIEDSDWADPATLYADTHYVFPCSLALERLNLKVASGTVNCVVELYIRPA